MCMNCGCGMPDETHGDPANLTAEDIRRAGDANGQSLVTTARHILDAAERLETTTDTGTMSGAAADDGWTPSMSGVDETDRGDRATTTSMSGLGETSGGTGPIGGFDQPTLDRYGGRSVEPPRGTPETES